MAWSERRIGRCSAPSALQDADFQKPIIAVANGYSTITPCNAGLNRLTERAVSTLREAGTMPQTFGTITVSDGISQGTEGMKYSLVSREVIADSIETVCQAQSVDGLLAIGGCDKNMPGAMIAIARLNIPSIFVYGGTIRPGHLQGEDLTIVSAFEAVGTVLRGQDQRGSAGLRSSVTRVPGIGSCGGMFTANTMSSAIEAMGLSLPYSSTMSADSDEVVENAGAVCEALAACRAKTDPAATTTHTRGFRKRDRGGDGVGGSTNAVLHLPAIAHAARRKTHARRL